jgi:hypothetical protein
MPYYNALAGRGPHYNYTAPQNPFGTELKAVLGSIQHNDKQQHGEQPKSRRENVLTMPQQANKAPKT